MQKVFYTKIYIFMHAIKEMEVPLINYNEYYFGHFPYFFILYVIHAVLHLQISHKCIKICNPITINLYLLIHISILDEMFSYFVLYNQKILWKINVLK